MSARYLGASVDDLRALLERARLQVQYGQAREARRQAMQDVEMIRAELRRRNVDPDKEAPACT